MIKYDAYDRTEPSRIYIARPGKRLLGVLNGIDHESCSLNLQFINTSEISFNVYKYLDGEKSSYYDYVDILMEIYVDGYGWFYIDESPTVYNDSIKEYKTVTAKSYEYTLHQYDLVGFDINTASETSREMMATDNVYTYHTTSEVWYNVFRDRVLFYRDSSEHKNLLDEMEQLTTYEELQQKLAKYPKVVYYDWRIEIAIDGTLRDGFITMKNNATSQGEILLWQDWIDNYDASTGVTSDSVKTLLLSYPELVKYITLKIDKTKYEFDSDTGEYKPTTETHTAYQLMEMEYQRIKELSLLDLVISDVPGWSIGEVDRRLYQEHSDINGSQILLQDEVGRFEVDSQDVYSFLVTDLAGYFDCVFLFDTINNKINAYRIESVGVDTKIFLGFRNVQNSVDITPAQDLFTRFTVENSEGLGITYVNFGEREISDISYFLNTKYLKQELIDKYRGYLEVRENRRQDYIDLSRRYNNKYNEAQEIYNRAPSDMLNISQLGQFTSQDQLEENIDNYYALMIGILNSFIYVSTDGITTPADKDQYADYNDYIAAMDLYISQLEDLVDIGKDSDAVPFEDSLFYADYFMMNVFTVPNLVIAHNNLSLPSYESKEEYYDSYEFNFGDDIDTDPPGYGWMYGIKELTAYQKSHADKMDVYRDYSTAWEDIPDTEEGNAYKAKYVQEDYNRNHNLYMKYKNGYDSATQALGRRNTEYDTVMGELDEINTQRRELADSVKLSNFILEQNLPAFTEEEINQIYHLFRHTDYVNDNINYLSNIDTSDDVIDKQLEMYKEAVDELYVESHPQYTYNSSVDDLLANNEYESYHPEFEVGNFIRIGLDDETQVQLRMISISINPMIYDSKIDIGFSNMIQYKAKRNDFVSLLNSALTSAKNSINARYNRNTDSDSTVQVTYDLVQKILQNSAFANVTQNIQQGSVNAVTGTFQTLAAGYIKTDELAAEVANITELHSDSAFMKYLEANLVVASEIKVDDLKAKLAQVDTLEADSAFMRYLEANLVVASEIKVDDLKAKLAQVDTLTSGSAFVNYLQTLSSTSAQSVINDAYIYNAVAGKISVADLAAGDITISNSARILSENGALVMNGTALQITGTYIDDEGVEHDYVGIQLGYDTSSSPSLILRNPDGATILTPQGITSDAIADELIVDDMISTGTISKSKLGFNIVEPNAQGGIDITQVYDGEGGLWGVQYTSFKNDTESALTALDEKIDESATYILYIDCPNGTNIHGQNVTLNAKLFKNSVEVTDDFDARYFTWTRQSSDYYGDLYWNNDHQTGTKSITITANDVRVNADFRCVFEYGDTTVISE